MVLICRVSCPENIVGAESDINFKKHHPIRSSNVKQECFNPEVYQYTIIFSEIQTLIFKKTKYLILKLRIHLSLSLLVAS